MAAEPTDSLKAIQEFISQWWVAFALTGLLLLVVAWKMNPRSANIIVALSWGILIVSAYRAPFFARQDTIPHVLFTTLFASALGLVLYFLLWTVIKDAPLNVLANMQSGQINDVTIASIQWSHNFGKLTIVVDNPTDMDYQDLDLLIQPDVLVAEAAQKTQVNGVAIWRDNIHSISLDNIDLATQHRTNFNYEPIAANTGYRVKAAVFPARTHTEFVFALVTIKIGPPAPPNPFDPNYVIQIASHSNETGEKFVVWFGSTKHTDAVFDNPPNIEKVKVKGHYTSQQIERRLDINMPVSDLTRDAVQQILKQQRQP